MFIELKDNYHFIGGHLYDKVSIDHKYLVLDKDSRAGYKIKDNNDNFIWISNTAFKKYFRKS